MTGNGWSEFDYQPDSEDIARPFIPFKLRCLGSEVDIDASGVADSGAERTLLIADFADALDIRLTEISKVPIYGISPKPIDGYPATLELKVEGLDDFIEMNVYFVRNLSVSGLLGQDQFFSKFRLLFDKVVGKVSVKENPALQFENERL